MAPFHIRLSARPQARLHPLLSIPWCQDVADLVRLPLHVASTAEFAEPALGLALDHGLAAYDAA